MRLLLLMLGHALAGDVEVAILIQGSDFINVSFVPSMDVNQFDLGDVFLSPCRMGEFSADHSGVCRPCAVCEQEQYEAVECRAYQNRVCRNCTACLRREAEMCACGNATARCPSGNRVCTPLASTSVNLTFQLSLGAPLLPLQALFLQQGLSTGFVLYLSTYLGHPAEDISLLTVAQRTPLQYVATFVLRDMYRPETLALLRGLTQDQIQAGLSSTFGLQSNSFATRRRLLTPTAIPIFAGFVETSCVSTAVCTGFFVPVDAADPCNTLCQPVPCPPGYTGDNGLCVPCANGTFKPTTGNDTCVACPPGYTSDRGAVDPSACRPAPATSPPVATSPLPAATSVLPVATSPLPATTSVLPAATSPLPAATSTSGRQPTSGIPVATSTGGRQTTSVLPVATSRPPVATSAPVQQAGGVQIVIINEGLGAAMELAVFLGLGLWLVCLCCLGCALFCRRHDGYELVPQHDPDGVVIPLVVRR